jgi:hypothetical protein
LDAYFPGLSDLRVFLAAGRRAFRGASVVAEDRMSLFFDAKYILRKPARAYPPLGNWNFKGEFGDIESNVFQREGKLKTGRRANRLPHP